MLTYSQWKRWRAWLRFAGTAVALVALYALGLVVLFGLAGCSWLHKDAALLEKSPVVEVVLHAEDAAAVKALCESQNNAADTSACNVGPLIFFFSAEAAADPVLRRHECQHVRDGRAMGWVAFARDYRDETSRVGYDLNRFEIAARAAGDDLKAPTPATDCK